MQNTGYYDSLPPLLPAPVDRNGSQMYSDGYRRENYNPTTDMVAFDGYPDRDDPRLNSISKPLGGTYELPSTPKPQPKPKPQPQIPKPIDSRYLQEDYSDHEDPDIDENIKMANWASRNDKFMDQPRRDSRNEKVESPVASKRFRTNGEIKNYGGPQENKYYIIKHPDLFLNGRLYPAWEEKVRIVTGSEMAENTGKMLDDHNNSAGQCNIL